MSDPTAAASANTSATSGQRSHSTGSRGQDQSAEREPRTATVRLPFVTARFRAPDVPWVREILDTTSSVTSAMWPPKRWAFYTGLGVLAVVEIVEWPIAVAVGAGTEIARRATGSGQTEPWPGYDQQNVEDINRHLADAEPKLARAVSDYERRHKNRSTVITEAEQKAH